ncbi:HIT family protein [Methanoculleus frigidifontis]|uniref:HIT family protein n=1 Tax=Methanoculleus frigidifontis TaxID=2584085 RepID=UPI0026587045|nr:HIT family protein [Methanoculleus sp. FWC-SCC1]
MLIVSFRHVAGFFDATDAEQAALLDLVREARRFLDEWFRPDGYTIGANVGEAAGQTVMHLHVILWYARGYGGADGWGAGGDSGEAGVLRGSLNSGL